MLRSTKCGVYYYNKFGIDSLRPCVCVDLIADEIVPIGLALMVYEYINFILYSVSSRSTLSCILYPVYQLYPVFCIQLINCILYSVSSISTISCILYPVY